MPILNFAGLTLLLCVSAGAPLPPSDKTVPARAQITVLYDAFGAVADMRPDWGYAAFIEYDGRRILFDTGNNADILAHNARVKGIDLSRLDFAVLSHRHGDHMGGMKHLLAVNPTVRIYAPKDGPGGVFGSDLPGSFYRRDSSLPTEQRYYGGAPQEKLVLGTAWPGANIELVASTTQIAPGIHLLALVSDRVGTLEMLELSLALDTPEGLVLVVGCSHPGIERIARAAASLKQQILLVAGGLHLVAAQDADIDAAAKVLRDTLKVTNVAPGHCTGEPAFAAFARVFGPRYQYAGLGATLTPGAEPSR